MCKFKFGSHIVSPFASPAFQSFWALQEFDKNLLADKAYKELSEYISAIQIKESDHRLSFWVVF